MKKYQAKSLSISQRSRLKAVNESEHKIVGNSNSISLFLNLDNSPFSQLTCTCHTDSITGSAHNINKKQEAIIRSAYGITRVQDKQGKKEMRNIRLDNGNFAYLALYVMK